MALREVVKECLGARITNTWLYDAENRRYGRVFETEAEHRDWLMNNKTEAVIVDPTAALAKNITNPAAATGQPQVHKGVQITPQEDKEIKDKATALGRQVFDADAAIRSALELSNQGQGPLAGQEEDPWY